MNKAAFGIIAVLALAIVCLTPVGFDSDGAITHDGDVLKVSTSETFEIVYTVDEADAEKKLTYNAKVVNKAGETMSGAVSPASGSLVSGEKTSITVTAPSTAGKYKLVVEYLLDEEKIVGKDDSFDFSAVNPIVLTVNLKAEEVTLDLEQFGVYFYIDGQKMDDSYTTVTLASDGTGSVSYDWIADPEGQHTFSVKAVGGSGIIKGLDEEHTFYATDNDYGLVTALAIIILVVLLIYAVVVYRKPVKNFGKPKSRR